MRLSLGCAEISVLIVIGALPITSQETTQPSIEPIIRVTVDLVQVDAVVTDSQGHHVVGLKTEDFLILEDGKPQKITHFSYVPGTVQSAPATQRAVVHPAGDAILQPLAPATALGPDQVHRTIVMIADDLGLSADDVPNVKKAMRTFIGQHMRTEDLVSIMTTSGGMGAMEQLTNDKRQLYASIERIHYVPERTGQTWYEPTNIWDAARAVQRKSGARLKNIRDATKVIDTLSTVKYAIQGLRDLPGRKAIALFSDGFNQSAEEIVQLANRASVVLYTFDPRGLVSFFLTAVDVCNTCAQHEQALKVKASERGREAVYHASQQSLDRMARATGGIFFHDDNDLARGLAESMDDLGGYYLLGYQPQPEDFDRVKGLPRFHTIEVRTVRHGLQVRSRNGFIGTPDPVVTGNEDTNTSQEQLRKALDSPFHANGFPVHLSAFYFASNEIDPKTHRRPTLVRAMLAIDAHGVRFGDAQDGRKVLTMEVLAAAFGGHDETVVKSDKTFSTAITPAEMDQIVASGLVYNLEFEISKPGPYQLRIAARDANSQRIGSATLFVEIPDFNGGGIALSSVQLSDSDSKRNEGLTRAGVIGGGSPVTRIFAPGAVLDYNCTVYGATIDNRTRTPRIDMTVRLIHGAEQIFQGEPTPLPIGNEDSRMSVPATGHIRLPATLPMGEYALEFTVVDRLQKKRSATAAQWVDFTLVRPD